MNIFNGLYYHMEGVANPVTVELRESRIIITLKDEYGKPVPVFWDYDKIIREEFWKGDRAVIKYIGFPVQVLEVSSTLFLHQLESHFRKKDSSFSRRVFGKNGTGLLKLLAIMLVLFVVTYFWGIPFIADRVARKVPVRFEEKMGEGMFVALKEGFTVDNRQTLLVNDFFSELAVPTGYPVKITVVKNDQANAFALPGGNIVVYDKILKEMDRYEELAALLCHEFTHINNRHATRSVFRQLGSSLFLSLIFGNLGAVSNSAIAQADQLKTLDYSRKLEKEADLNGLRLLSERRIDGNGFVNLFRLLEEDAQQTGTEQPQEWISSHPDLEKRITYIRKDNAFNSRGVISHEVLQTLFDKLKDSFTGN